MNQELLDRIDALALKLGTTTEYLWPSLVGAVRVNGIIAITVVTIFLIISGFLVRLALKSESEEPIVFSTVICVILSIVSVIVWSCSMANILYPEARAFKDLMRVF